MRWSTNLDQQVGKRLDKGMAVFLRVLCKLLGEGSRALGAGLMGAWART